MNYNSIWSNKASESILPRLLRGLTPCIRTCFKMASGHGTCARYGKAELLHLMSGQKKDCKWGRVTTIIRDTTNRVKSLVKLWTQRGCANNFVQAIHQGLLIEGSRF